MYSGHVYSGHAGVRIPRLINGNVTNGSRRVDNAARRQEDSRAYDGADDQTDAVPHRQVLLQFDFVVHLTLVQRFQAVSVHRIAFLGHIDQSGNGIWMEWKRTTELWKRS